MHYILCLYWIACMYVWIQFCGHVLGRTEWFRKHLICIDYVMILFVPEKIALSSSERNVPNQHLTRQNQVFRFLYRFQQ